MTRLSHRLLRLRLHLLLHRNICARVTRNERVTLLLPQ